MSSQTIYIESVGDVLFTKSNRSTRIRLTVKAQGVFVSLPASVPYAEAIRFVESKTDWIVEQQSKLTSGLPLWGPDTQFTTKFHRLKISCGHFAKVQSSVGKGVVQFFIPEKYDWRMPAIQEFIKKTLIEVMRLEAKTYLPGRVDELARQYDLSYRQVFIKNASTRWGSCSSENNINLNLHLMRLPQHLIDYVVLHELAHTVEKNHGPRFWKLLDSMTGSSSKKLRNEMKQYHMTGW